MRDQIQKRADLCIRKRPSQLEQRYAFAFNRFENSFDRIESDFLQFTSGTIARVGVAKQSARLVVG